VHALSGAHHRRTTSLRRATSCAARRLAVAVASTAAVALAACAAGSGGGAPAGDAGLPTDAAARDAPTASRTCQPGEAKLWGTVDGASFERTYAATGFTISGGDVRGSLGTYGKVRMARTSTSTSEQQVRWALLVMPREGPYPDLLFCAGAASTMARELQPLTFTLRGLFLDSSPRGTFTPLELPDSGACDGNAVLGEIEGCIGPGR
jgi:hypothetical protein